MKKILTAALMAATLSMGLFSAGMALPESASAASCVDGGIKHAGATVYLGGSKDVRGVQAHIAATGNFDPCTQNAGNDGPLAWVALQPSPASNDYNNGIVQIGIVNCNTPLKASCDTSTPHFFWASGGCGITVPTIVNLGYADGGDHTYKITYSSGRIKGYIDGVVKFDVDNNYGSLFCWIDDPKFAVYSVETHDRGDIMGTSSSNLFIDYATYWPNASSTWTSGFTGTFNEATLGYGRIVMSHDSNTVRVYTAY